MRQPPEVDIMTFLRFFLFAVLFYYAIKWLWGLLFAPGGRRTQDGEKGGVDDYSELTDQKIEDTDFEDIKPGDEG